MMRLFLTLSALAAVTALPGAAETRFDGRYQHPVEQCAGSDGTVVGNGRIRFFGADCALDNPTGIRGMSAMLFDMACPLEGGGTYSERVMLSFDPEGGLLVVRDGAWYSFPRCP